MKLLLVLVLSIISARFLFYPGFYTFHDEAHIANLYQMTRGLKEGQFPDGSMGPKIKAAVDFLEYGGEKVIITSPSMAKKAVTDKAGTLITREAAIK